MNYGNFIVFFFGGGFNVHLMIQLFFFALLEWMHAACEILAPQDPGWTGVFDQMTCFICAQARMPFDEALWDQKFGFWFEGPTSKCGWMAGLFLFSMGHGVGAYTGVKFAFDIGDSVGNASCLCEGFFCCCLGKK